MYESNEHSETWQMKNTRWELWLVLMPAVHSWACVMVLLLCNKAHLMQLTEQKNGMWVICFTTDRNLFLSPRTNLMDIVLCDSVWVKCWNIEIKADLIPWHSWQSTTTGHCWITTNNDIEHSKTAKCCSQDWCCCLCKNTQNEAHFKNKLTTIPKNQPSCQRIKKEKGRSRERERDQDRLRDQERVRDQERQVEWKSDYLIN